MAYLPPINGGRINLSVASVQSNGTVVLSGGNNVSLGQAGSTISINAPGTTVSQWVSPQQAFASLNGMGLGSLSVQHQYVPFNVTGSAMKIGGSLSVVNNIAAGGLRSGSISLWMGIYTLNGSTLSLASSGSANNTLGYNVATASTSQNSSVTGMRQLTVPMNIHMPPGEYWVGAVMSTSAVTATQGFGYTVYGNDQVTGGASNLAVAPIGSNMTAARDVMFFQGMHTSVAYTMPTAIQNADINNMSASYVRWANFYNAVYNVNI